MSDRGSRIFIPMSIDQTSTTRAGYFFSPLKSVVMVGGLVPGIIWASFVYSSSGNSVIALLISIFLYLIVYFYLIRFVVFEELRLKKMLRNLDENKKSKVDYFWGIDNIDDEGVIHYRYNVGLKKAVVVKIVRGSTVGVRPNFDERFKSCNLTFTQGLLKNNFSYEKRTKLEERVLPKGLEDYTRKLRGITDEAQRAVVKLNMDTISNFVKDNKSVTVDYYVIYNTDIRLMNMFKSVVNDLITTAYGNEVYFRGTRVLEKDEVTRFFAETLAIKSVNTQGYFDDESYDFEDFGELFRILDKEGKEVLFDLEEDVEHSLDVLDVRGGKSIDQLEEEFLSGVEEDVKEDEVIYLDEGEELELEEGYEYVYVDEEGNEVAMSEEELKEMEVEEVKEEVEKSSKLDSDVDLFNM